MASFRRKMRIGELLLSRELITEEQLQHALEEKKKTDSLLGDVIVSLGYVPQDVMIEVLKKHLNIDYIDVREIALDDTIVKLLPENLLRKHNILPLYYDEEKANTLTVAMSDPMNLDAADDVMVYTGYQVKPILAMRDHINSALDKIFGKSKADDIAAQIKEEQGLAA